MSKDERIAKALWHAERGQSRQAADLLRPLVAKQKKPDPAPVEA